MTDEIAKLGLEVDSRGFVRAKRDLEQFNVTADRSERKSRDLERSMRRAGRTAGRVMGVAATALAGIAANSVRMASTFESELTKINTLVGISRDQIDDYRDAILDLAPAVGRGPEELARAMFAITSAGARGQAALDILEASSRAAAIGLGDTRDIALAAGAAVTAYGEDTLNASEAVDIMIGTIEQGNLEASQLAGVLGRVLGLAAQAGVSFQDAGAFIAAFTRQGVDAAQAVTGLRGALTLLVREPTKRTTEAFEQMGWSVGELQQAVEDRGFISAFQEMVDRADAAGISMGNIIPEVEALAGVMAVFASEGESAASIAESVGNAMGTLDQRFAEAVENDPALAFAMIRAEFETMSVRLGQDLLPGLMMLVREMQGVDGEASALRETLNSVAIIVLRLAEFATFAGGVLGELGRRMGQVGANIGVLTQEFDSDSLWKPFEGYMDVLRTLGNARDLIRETGEVNQAASEDVDDHWASVMDMMESYAAARRELENFDPAAKAVETQVKNTAKAFGEMAKQLLTLGGPSGSGGGSLSDLEGEGIGLRRTLEDLEGSTIDWLGRLEDLEAELDGELAQAALRYRREVLAVTLAHNEGQIDADQFRRYLDALAREYYNVADAAAAAASAQAGAIGAAIGGDVGAGITGGFDFGGLFSQLGSNFAQSIFNGQGIRESLSSAFTGFGGQRMSESVNTFFEDAMENGISNAFSASRTQEGMAAGFSMAIGQALEGNYAQAAFTAAGTAIGGPIGGVIGSIVGSLVEGLLGGRDPAFSVGGSRGDNQFGADEVFESALGPLAFGFRKVPGEARRTIMDAFIQVDQALIGAIRDRGLLEITRRAIETWGEKDDLEGADLAGMIESRLDAVLATLPPVIQAAVEEFAGTVEQQVEVLADILSINRALRGGGSGLGFMPAGTGNTDSSSLVNSQLEQTVEVLGIVRIGSESLSQTFARMASIMETLDLAAAVTGARFAETRRDMVIFGADLAAFFGDNADAVARAYNRIFEAFYTEEERAAAEAGANTARATSLLNDLFAQIGGSVSPLYDSFDASMLTAEGFRELFEALTSAGVLTAQQTALLLQAGEAVADLTESERELLEARTDQAAAIADLQSELDNALFNEFASEFRRTRRDIMQQSADWIERATELGTAEQMLGQIREIEAARLGALAGQVRSSLVSLIGSLNGAGEIGSATSSAMGQIGQIADANRSRYEEELRAIQGIRDYVDGFFSSELSPLDPGGRVDAARNRLMETLLAAEGGDIDAMASVTGQADEFFRLFREFTGGVGDYPPEVMAIMERLDALGDRQPQSLPPTQRPPTAFEVAGGFQGVSSALDGVARVQQLFRVIDELALLADLTGDTPFEIAEELDAPIREIIEALGGDPTDLSGPELADLFNSLITAAGAAPTELGQIVGTSFDQLDELMLHTQALNELIRLAGGTPVAPGDETGPPPPPSAPAPPPSLQGTGTGDGIESRLERIEAAILDGNRGRESGSRRVEAEVGKVAATIERSSRDASMAAFAGRNSRGR